MQGVYRELSEKNGFAQFAQHMEAKKHVWMRIKKVHRYDQKFYTIFVLFKYY